MVETVTTTDLYESTYYLLTGCELEGIEGMRVNGKITCRLSFRSPKIPQLQMDYFQGGAEVNLLQFRRAYGQINALVRSAKKKAKAQLSRRSARPEGGPT